MLRPRLLQSVLKAYELLGTTKTDDASVWGLTHAMCALKELDLTSTEGRPIVQLLEGMGSALRFALDHPLSHFSPAGWNTAALSAVSTAHQIDQFPRVLTIGLQILCALAFGKNEDGGTQKLRLGARAASRGGAQPPA